MKKKIICLLVAACFLFASACSAQGETGNEETEKENETQVSQVETEDDADDSAGQQDQEDSLVDEVAEEPKDVEEDAQEEGAEALEMGSEAELGDWTISVSGFEFTDRIDNTYSYFEPGDGNKYAVVSVSVANNGTEADSFLPSFGFGDDVGAKILYDWQYQYSATQLLGYDEDLHDEFLNPLSSATGVIIFEMPEVVASGSEPLQIIFDAGSENVTFNLR